MLIDCLRQVSKATNAAAKAALHAVDCAKDTDRCCREAVAAFAEGGYAAEGPQEPRTTRPPAESEDKDDCKLLVYLYLFQPPSTPHRTVRALTPRQVRAQRTSRLPRRSPRPCPVPLTELSSRGSTTSSCS